MYECTDCGQRFEIPAYRIDRHGLDNPPYEKTAVCPTCKGGRFREARTLFCRCCGARLDTEHTDYCGDECRNRAIRLRRKAAQRYERRRNDPLEIMVRQVEAYNREHGTRYSYGQFVAYILPKLEKERVQIEQKRKETTSA